MPKDPHAYIPGTQFIVLPEGGSLDQLGASPRPSTATSWRLPNGLERPYCDKHLRPSQYLLLRASISNRIRSIYILEGGGHEITEATQSGL